MSLFQCDECGCMENTALSHQGFAMLQECFDWTNIENLKGKSLCIACGPTKYSDGKSTGCGTWHNKFKRMYLPKGMFITNRKGNLEHKLTGDDNIEKYEIK